MIPKFLWITPSVLKQINILYIFVYCREKISPLYSLYRDHHLECSPIRNSAISSNRSVINSKSFQCSLNKEKIFQGHCVLSEITHPVTVMCCSGNLYANINGYTQQQDPAEINPETTLIPFTQEKIKIVLVGVEINKNQWLWKIIALCGSVISFYNH